MEWTTKVTVGHFYVTSKKEQNLKVKQLWYTISFILFIN